MKTDLKTLQLAKDLLEELANIVVFLREEKRSPEKKSSVTISLWGVSGKDNGLSFEFPLDSFDLINKMKEREEEILKKLEKL